MERSVYCKCINNYIIESKCKCKEVPDYWRQGVGTTKE